MMRTLVTVALLAVSAAAGAGVALDMVTRDMAGNETERSRIYAQDGFLRLDSNGGPFASDVSLIFDGGRFLVMDHGEKTVIVMDEAMLMRMTDRMNEAMAQMEAELEKMPPKDRAMAEQMFKSRMQGMMGGEEPAPPPRVEKTGTSEWDGRACTTFDVFEGGIKTQEICAAPLDRINGAAEMMQTYQVMADFVKKLSESLPGPLGESFNEYPGMVAELIGGFPIRTVEYRMGAPASEVVLESITEQALEPAMFEVPADYALQDPFGAR